MRDQKGFDEWALLYDDFVKDHEEAKVYPFAGYNEILKTILTKVSTKKNPYILDLGFGTGNLTQMMTSISDNIYGQDFSATMKEVALKKVPKAKLYIGDFKDGLVPELQKHRFDFIVATYALHHLNLNEKLKFIDELKRYLTTDGKIIIGDVAFATFDEQMKCREQFLDLWDDDEFYFIEEELKPFYPNLTFQKISVCGGIMEIENEQKVKTVAITGSTGGLGSEMVKKLAKDGYNFILLNRNETKTNQQIAELKAINQAIKIDFVKLDMEKLSDIQNVVSYLNQHHFDYFIGNAAIYNVPIEKLESGFNNIFFVNFVGLYYLTRKLQLKEDVERFIIVGSVAYNFAKLDESDLDHTKKNKTNDVYGNSKRFLMMSLYEAFKNDPRLAIVHPGVVYTNITSHFPKWINWFIVLFIRLLFPTAKKASRVLLDGIKRSTAYLDWIGPKVLGLWGGPKVKHIKNMKQDEIEKIASHAEAIYKKM